MMEVAVTVTGASAWIRLWSLCYRAYEGEGIFSVWLRYPLEFRFLVSPPPPPNRRSSCLLVSRFIRDQ